MTVQNTKLSGYNPNRQPASIPSYLGLPRISSWKKFANLLEPDTPNKLKCDCFCAGRSMVEMLGVLAIVGVLSVGAIAGYSKAMMKYRLNKQAEQLNTIFNLMERHLYSFADIKSNVFLTPYFIKMGEIPKEMIIPENNNSIKDVFGTPISLKKEYYPRENGTAIGVYIIYITPVLDKKSSENTDICRNFVSVAKEHADTLYAIQSYATNSTNVNMLSLMGDKYCTGSFKCIRDLTLNDIVDFCNLQVGQPHGGQLAISWHDN